METIPALWQLSATGFSWTPDVVRAAVPAPDIMVKVVADGITSIVEIEAGQTWRSFPVPDDAEVDELRDRLASVGGSVSTVGASLDDWISPDSRRSEDQRFAFLEPQLHAAKRLGAQSIRLPIGQAGPALLRRLQPLLEELNLVLLEEIQGSQNPTDDLYRAALDDIAALDTPRIRVLIDTSMLMPSLPPSYVERIRAGGVPNDLADLLSNRWLEPETAVEVQNFLRSGAVPGSVFALYMNMVVRYGRLRASDLRDVLPLVGGIHLKFWDLDDENGRVSSPIRELGTELLRAGYSGTICSEWGGHEWLDDDPSSITRAHLNLARKALAEGAVAAR